MVVMYLYQNLLGKVIIYEGQPKRYRCEEERKVLLGILRNEIKKRSILRWSLGGHDAAL